MRNAAVVAPTKNLADEPGPSGINVTVVHPGLTRTQRTAALFATEAERQGIPQHEFERRVAHNLVGRVIDATEVAHVVAFLAPPRAIAINGDVVAVGGGTAGVIHY